MLSFSEGKAIAKIKGGKMDGETIFVTDIPFCCGRCGYHCMKRKCCPGCIYSRDSSDDIGTGLVLKDGIMIPTPNLEDRDTPYVAGPSGSGKSTYIGKYAEEYKKNFRKNPVFVFSRKPKDEALDFLKPIRIIIDDELIEDPIDTLQEMKNSLVIFDDTDTIQDSLLKQAVSKLKNDILETGRANKIYTIISCHLINPNERKDGRIILNECSSITIFPKSGSTYQIEYALKKYFGMSPKQIKKILDLPSRWVTIYKNFPQVVLYENGAYLLNK